jgi:hypothetical protein
VFWLVEGVLRTAIFLGYLALLSRLNDLRRVFEYHGAEHKTISCYEAGQPLTPENAQRYSRPAPALRHELPAHRHDRAIFVFAPLGLPEWYLLVASADHRRAADRRPVVRGSSSSPAATAASAGSRR